MHAGRATERRHAQARVVRERGQTRPSARMARLDKRVFDKSLVRFLGFGDAEFRLSQYFNAERFQQQAYLA